MATLALLPTFAEFAENGVHQDPESQEGCNNEIWERVYICNNRRQVISYYGVEGNGYNERWRWTIFLSFLVSCFRLSFALVGLYRREKNSLGRHSPAGQFPDPTGRGPSLRRRSSEADCDGYRDVRCNRIKPP
ncbi:uncharacterized protein LOC143215002 [Lasioglossum baleicum]|uniref:uncharacterized protein LOC143215002 n=1 Tax=Lasioglossum baleicum TaxID=434251 RepID=UPI003FCEDA3F